jgi:predicted DNA-binding protein with PD1-like motif
MNVRESRRTRHLVIRLDRGDELPAALVRALDEAEARSAFVTGVGSFEAADLAVYDQAARAWGKARRLEGGVEALSIDGNVALLDGATTVRLSATVARETELGREVAGGQLVWARAFAVELCVTVLDDVTLTRMADERTGLPVLSARPAAGAPAEAARPLAAVAAIPLPAAPPPPPPPPPPPAANHDGPALPQKPMRPRDEIEAYPEVGDRVAHFHFGECTVVGSDGDRIRLQQDKDGRVREVALTMLRIEAPTDLPEGKRHFTLGRKN